MNAYELPTQTLNRLYDLELRVRKLEGRKRKPFLVVDEKYSKQDGLYPQAKQLVIEMGYATASLLQRYLRIGYVRAGRLVNLLEEDGVIGHAEDAKPRRVLIEDPTD